MIFVLCEEVSSVNSPVYPLCWMEQLIVRGRTWTYIMMCHLKKKRERERKRAWTAQSELFFTILSEPKDLCHPHVCTVSPVKSRP